MLPSEVLKKIRRIQITTRRAVEDTLGGEYHSVFKGRGMEFDEVRPYQPGDDIRSIDWNVTSRTGHLHVKRFVEERELTVMLLIDASASMRFGSDQHTKSEICAEIAALLAFSAIRNNDKVGALFFTENVERYVPPRKGSKHVLRLVRDILCYQPSGRGTSLEAALRTLNLTVTKRCVAFLFSDFGGPDFTKPLRVANRKHDLVAVPIEDRRESLMPSAGIVYWEDAETGRQLVMDTSLPSVRQILKQFAENRRLQRQKIFRTAGVDFIEIFSDQPYEIPLVRFFRRRALRMRRG